MEKKRGPRAPHPNRVAPEVEQRILHYALDWPTHGQQRVANELRTAASCGKPESHPFELLLAMESIEHRTTKIRSPRTNGFVERMNRTLLDEFSQVCRGTSKSASRHQDSRR